MLGVYLFAMQFLKNKTFTILDMHHPSLVSARVAWFSKEYKT